MGIMGARKSPHLKRNKGEEQSCCRITLAIEGDGGARGVPRDEPDET